MSIYTPFSCCSKNKGFNTLSGTFCCIFPVQSPLLESVSGLAPVPEELLEGNKQYVDFSAAADNISK